MFPTIPNRSVVLCIIEKYKPRQSHRRLSFFIGGNMKTVKVDLPQSLKQIEVHILADLHIGDRFCNMEGIKERIEHIKNTPNAYCILNGDLMNNATKTSVSDSYAEKYTPMEQVEMCMELLEPIKDKIIAITSGNHEKRTYNKEGIDITKLVALQLKLGERYSPTACLIFLRVGKARQNHGRENGQICYTIYCTHGSGGGRKEGAKAIRLADMASIVDADCYCHSHSHLPMIMKQGFYRVSASNSSIARVDKLFVNKSEMLEYGGYGEAFEFKH